MTCPQESTDVHAKALKDADENKRRRAVEELASAGTAAAWALVASALADASPLVADEAQMRLGGIADPAAVEVLFGKSGLDSKDACVRRRAAEALGRIGVEVDGAGLAKRLGDRDPQVRRGILRAVEKLAVWERVSEEGRSALVKRIDQLLKSEKVLDVRAGALPARFALLPFTLPELWNWLNQKDAGVVRGSATHLASLIDVNGLIRLYDDAVESSNPGALRALVDALIAQSSAVSAQSLVSVLERRKQLRLQWWIADALQDWSGKTFGLDAELWRGWADTLSPGWKPPARTEAVRRLHPSEPNLCGMPILSDSMAILVDMTGWTAEEDAGGATGKARFRKELERMLRSLPQHSTFKLVPYAESPVECGRDWLLEVRLESINGALKCFGECKASGQDNFLEAARRALIVPGIDTIVVVTDSAPSGARHVHPDLVLEELTLDNRFRGVFIEALLVGSDAEVEKQWKRLCDRWGGRVMTARL